MLHSQSSPYISVKKTAALPEEHIPRTGYTQKPVLLREPLIRLAFRSGVYSRPASFFTEKKRVFIEFNLKEKRRPDSFVYYSIWKIILCGQFTFHRIFVRFFI